MTLGQMLTDLNARIGSSPEVSNANMTTSAGWWGGGALGSHW